MILRVLMLYAAVVTLLFRRAIIPPSGWLLFGDDIHRSYYFYRSFFNGWIRDGVLAWWNPYLFGGTPFVADPITNIWYPVNWLYLILPLNLAYSWHVAFHLVWAMTGMFVLLTLLRLAPVASFTGGLLFGLSGFFMARTWSGHVDVLAAASFLPWVVWAIAKSQETRKPRDMAVACVVFALQLLSGYQTMALMTVIAVGVYTAVWTAVDRSWVRIRVAALCGIGGIGLAAFHLVPVQEFFLSSIRTYSLPYSWVSYGAWKAESLIQMLHPFYFGDQRLYNGPPPNYGEHSAFIGVIGLMLAGLALVSLRKATIRVRVVLTAFIVLVVFGAWMSLGPNAPVDLQYLAWKTIPAYAYLRIPTRHLILVSFGLSALAAFGLNAAGRKRMPWIMPVVAVLAAAEMLRFGAHFIELQPVPESRHDRGLIASLTEREPYRVLQNFGVWMPAREVFDFDSAAQYRIFSATGYGPGIYRPYFEYIARSTGVRGETAMLSHDVQVPYLTPAQGGVIDRLNIKYIIVPPDHDPFQGADRYKLLREDVEQQFRLYENTTVLPRFYLSDPSCGKPEVVSYSPNRIELTLTSTCAATLLSSEVWYPGWRAYVDGKNVNIDKLDGVFRTIFVTGGKHTVVYEYRPTIFIVGLLISLGTAVVLYAAAKRKR